MKNWSKNVTVLFVILALTFFTVGCRGKESPSEGESNPEEAVPNASAQTQQATSDQAQTRTKTSVGGKQEIEPQPEQKETQEPNMKVDVEQIAAEISEMDNQTLTSLVHKAVAELPALSGVLEGSTSDVGLRAVLAALRVKEKYGEEGLDVLKLVYEERLHDLKEHETYFGVGNARLKTLAIKEDRRADFIVTADSRKWLKPGTSLKKEGEAIQLIQPPNKDEKTHTSSANTKTQLPASIAKQANESFASGLQYFIWVAAKPLKHVDHIVVPMYCIASPSVAKPPSFVCIVHQSFLSKYEGATALENAVSKLSPTDGEGWTATKSYPEKFPLGFSREGFRIGHGNGVIIYLIESSEQAFEMAKPISNSLLIDKLLYDR